MVLGVVSPSQLKSRLDPKPEQQPTELEPKPEPKPEPELTTISRRNLMARDIWEIAEKKGMLIRRRVQVFNQEDTNDRGTKIVKRHESNYKKNFEVRPRNYETYPENRNNGVL